MDTDNGWLTQVGEPTMDWRINLQPDSRERIANKLMETLKRHVPFSGEGAQELKKIAVKFEEKIYTAARSQSDYLRKISLKMLAMEEKSQNTLLNSMQSYPANNSKPPPDQDSQSMQSQVNNQRQPLPIPVLTNQSVLPQNVHSNIPSTGMQGSASLTTGLPLVSSLPESTRANVVVPTSNLQDIQNISGVSQNTLGNSMGQGVPSNIFANYQRQTQQYLSQQQLQQHLYQQQLQQQFMKQKFQQGKIQHSLMQSHLQHSVHMLPQSKVPVQQQTEQNVIDHQKQLFQSQIAIPAASSTSLDSIAQTGNANIGDWQGEVYQKVMSQDSVNSYVSCYCGDPAPIKMCWTDDNPGRRFVGCRNNAQLCGFFDWIDPQKTPREKVHEFYCKNQDLKSQNEQVNQMSKVVEEMNLKLQQINGLLEKSIEVEQQMNLEWKNKFVDLKKMYRKDDMKKKWTIVLLLTLLIFSWFNRLY